MVFKKKKGYNNPAARTNLKGRCVVYFVVVLLFVSFAILFKYRLLNIETGSVK